MESHSLHHRTDQYWQVVQGVTEKSRTLFGCRNAEVLLFAGSGTYMLEAVAANFLAPGDGILIINTGFFADKWHRIALDYGSHIGAEIYNCEFPWGTTYNLQRVMDEVKNREVRLVLMQATDTATGVRNDCGSVGNLLRSVFPNALLAVDAVLEAGVSPLKMNSLGIDILIGSGQKAFMLPPGLGFAVLNSRAKERLLSQPAAFPEYSLSFRGAMKATEKKDVRSTPPVDQIAGFNAVLEHIFKDEWGWYGGHLKRSNFLRGEVLDLGYKLFTLDSPSSGLSVFSVPGGNAGDLVRRIEKRGLIIAQGIDKNKDTAIRIAHFAGVREKDIKKLIRILKEIRRE